MNPLASTSALRPTAVARRGARRPVHRLVALVALTARVALTPALAAPPAEAVPAALDPGPAAAHVATLAATGVQVYECRATPADAGASHRWVFVAPEARLYDARKRFVGWHGEGPHWRADDGSRIDGTVKTRADAPVAGTIPWLLLATTASGTAPGRFAGVTSVQRVNTTGGAPPAAPCDAAHAGARARVPYTADYRLFRAVVPDDDPVPGTRGVVYLPAHYEAAARAAQAAAPLATF